MNGKSLAILASVAGALLPAAAGADAVGGRAKFEAACAECHEPGEWAKTAPAELRATLAGIAAGRIKHKGKLKLTDEEIADLVAYLTPAKADVAAVAPAKAPPATATTPKTTATATAPTTAKTPTTARAPTPPAAGASGASATAAAAPSTPAAPTTAASRPAAVAKAAPAAAGAVDARRTFDAQCAECHEANEYAGRSAADLEKTLAGIAAGKIKHKGKVKPTAAEQKALAAFLAAGG